MIDTKLLRQKLIDMAMRGLLVEQRPEEGNATDLLEQIRAEKAAMIKAGKIKKEKPLPEIKEEEKPFAIPDSWCWVRLGEICSNIRYGTSNKSEKKGTTIVLRMGNIQNGVIDYSDLVYTSDAEDIKTYKLEYGDLLFNRTNSKELVGKTAIYKAEYPAIYAGYLVRVTALIAKSEYLNFTMQSEYYKEWCRRVRSNGVNQSNINAEKLKRLLIPLPPLAEQKRIVAALEACLKLVDTIAKDSADLDKALKFLRQKMLDMAMRGQLVEQRPEEGKATDLLEQIRAEKAALIKAGKIKKEKPLPEIKEEEKPFAIPANWCWVRFSDVLDVRDGTHDTPKYVPTGIPLVTSKNFINGNIIFDTSRFISQEDADLINARSKVDTNDILLAMIGTIGNPVLIDKDRDFCIKNVALFKKVSELLLMKYVFYYLTGEQYMMRRKAVGGVQKFVSLNFLRAYLIPLPPLAEQKRIVAKLEQINALIETMLN